MHKLFSRILLSFLVSLFYFLGTSCYALPQLDKEKLPTKDIEGMPYLNTAMQQRRVRRGYAVAESAYRRYSGVIQYNHRVVIVQQG